MTQQPDDRAQRARQFYEAKDFEAAGRLYHQLWDEQGDAFSGGRYALCLRKCGYPQAALTVARQVAQKHPDNIYVGREVVWALYEAELKPAKERGDLGVLVQTGQQILDLTDEELPVRLVSFAVISLAKDKMKWSLVSDWCDRLDRRELSTEPREMGGRRVISEREQWYFAKIKSLVQLKQWEEARELALEEEGIPFEYEPRLPYTDDDSRTHFIHPNFYLYKHDLHMEYWGRDNPEYVKSRRFKERVYEQLAHQRGVRKLHLEAGNVEKDVFVGKVQAAISPDD